MRKLYASPVRVYLCLAVLALAGIVAGLRLPVSLFPNSSKPLVGVSISYGDSTANEFLHAFGDGLESQLRAISTDTLEVEDVKATYNANAVDYRVQFKWGAPPKAAEREVESVVNSFGARFPKEIRDSIAVWGHSANSGFLAISFYSSRRSLDELYDLLEPILVPKIAKVRDASDPGLWNPTQKEVRIELDPTAMATLGLFPKDAERAIQDALTARSAGSVTVGTRQFSAQMPRNADTVDDLGRALVSTPGGRIIHLRDIARIDLGPKSSESRSFKTSGAPSIILFAQPRPDGNVKRMSEDIIEVVRQTMPSLPDDIEYKILVDPSEFIRASVKNVFHEVLLGATLAVIVLFLFIGSLRNTITAAIEIPLSMVLAFILMKISGMNLNLVSLGGLALAAGMNVDASVVVMENIFRHFENIGKDISMARRLDIVTRAVNEVRFSVIASTIASLVVFVPLAFTSDLSYAILGDLAKTVVFSHGFSAIVALVLVPTVRLHLMNRGGQAHSVPPLEPVLKFFEDAYATWLGRLLANPRIKWIASATLTVFLAMLLAVALPRLPREIIGRPDTDWMILGINTKGNRLMKQMESQAEETEKQLLNEFKGQFQYTFNQIIGPNAAYLMARLKDKKSMMPIWKAMEKKFANTPLATFWVAPWNPAELPIPDPPHLSISVRGGKDAKERAVVAEEITTLLNEHKIFPRNNVHPNPERREDIVIRPNLEQWSALSAQGHRFLPSDLADLTRVATDGRKAGQIAIGSKMTDIVLSYPEGALSTVEDLAALPVGVGAKLIPLKALARIGVEEVQPSTYREDGRELFLITGKQDEEHKADVATSRRKAHELIEKWKSSRKSQGGPAVAFEDAEKDLHEALHQLGIAVALSILLILLTLVVQFGELMSALLVLVAVPLGFIGVVTSLVAFKSTLSLNSILGVILLNGIAVANSIILVDFLKQLVARGHSPRDAAMEAARKRLRPILITSLTTVLGMLPIALGMGEGGRILQPLGIAVSGGLWFSMGLALFIVPAFQVAYLERREKRRLARDVELKVAALNQASATTPRTGILGLSFLFDRLRQIRPNVRAVQVSSPPKTFDVPPPDHIH